MKDALKRNKNGSGRVVRKLLQESRRENGSLDIDRAVEIEGSR